MATLKSSSLESSKRFIKITFEALWSPVDLVAENKNRTVWELLVCQQGLQLALGLFESSPEQNTLDKCASAHSLSAYISTAEEKISHLYVVTYHKSRQGRRWRRLLGNNLSTLFSPGGGHQDQRWWIWKNSKLWARQPLRISIISGLAEICYDSKVTWSCRCWAPQRWDGGWGRVGPSCHPGARRRALCL